MNSKIHKAIDRLHNILPLHAQRNRLNQQGAALHHMLLRSFVENGRILQRREISALVDNADAVISELAAKGLIVCDANNNPIGAYPFTMEQRVHRIRVNDFNVHAMCALDALAVSLMFDYPVVIDSQCAISKAPIHIMQHANVIQNSHQLRGVRFAINWDAAVEGSCCANSLCTEMIFIRDETDASRWLVAEDSKDRELFNLNEAVEFAGAFFIPLLK